MASVKWKFLLLSIAASVTLTLSQTVTTAKPAPTLVLNRTAVALFNASRITLAELHSSLILGPRQPAPNRGQQPSNASEQVTTAEPASSTQIVFVESNDTVSESMVATFDCRRAGHDCSIEGGMCDLDTGLCKCGDNYGGYDCAYEVSQVTNASNCNWGHGCGDDVESLCLLPPMGLVEQGVCFCSYSTFGLKCERPRYELRCSETFMTINVAPFTSEDTFTGHVFVVDSSTNVKIDASECDFGNLTQDGVFSLAVSYADLLAKCGGVHEAENETHSLKFVVQSDSEWLTTYDQIVTAQCSLLTGQEYQKTIVVEVGGEAAIGQPPAGQVGAKPGPSSLHVSNSLSNIGVQEIKAERKQIAISRIVPKPILTLGLPGQGRGAEENVVVPISGPVKLGDVVVFTIENVNDTFYTAIRAEECTLNMDETMEAKLIKDACPSSRFAWNLLQWQKTIKTNVSVSFYLRLPANAMAGHPRQLTISCRVKLCALDLVSECASDEDGCKNATSKFLAQSVQASNFGRRKRRHIDGHEHDFLLSEDEEPDWEPTKIVFVKKTVEIAYDEPSTSKNRPASAVASNNQRKTSASSSVSSATSLLAFKCCSCLSSLLLLLSMFAASFVITTAASAFY